MKLMRLPFRVNSSGLAAGWYVRSSANLGRALLSRELSRGPTADESDILTGPDWSVFMYVVADGVKQDPVRRWSLPDRVFFACGACHVLAFAFLKAYPQSGFAPLWIKPSKGFTGNHVVVVREDIAFDYHGFSSWSHLFGHMEAKANRWWPGWSAQLIPLPAEVLISESKSREYDGLWLREPKQYLRDAMPRAEQYLRRFPCPPE